MPCIPPRCSRRKRSNAHIASKQQHDRTEKPFRPHTIAIAPEQDSAESRLQPSVSLANVAEIGKPGYRYKRNKKISGFWVAVWEFLSLKT
jgi:hypothetical protein